MELLRGLSITMLLLVLFGCGGGDGGLSNNENPDPNTGNDDPDIAITLSLSNSTVSDAEPVIVTATVTQNNQALGNKLVTFSLVEDDQALARFSPENGAATTNADGVVDIELLVGTTSGGGTIIATVVSDSNEAVTASIDFNSSGDGDVVVVGPDVAEINLFANSQQLASSGAQEIALTAIAKDENNNLLAGVTIGFKADSGQLQVTNNVTGENGQAVAILRTQGAPANRTIEVVANNGEVSDIVNVDVVGTTVQLAGSSSLALNDENNFIVNVLDSDSVGIADAEVSLSLSNGAASSIATIELPETVTTDSSGQATISIVGTSGGSNSIIATALGASVSKNVSVQADSFLFTRFNNGNGSLVNPSDSVSVPDVLLSDTATITLTWSRSGNSVADGTLVEFTTTRGSLSANSGVINNGQVSVNVNSNDAGKAIVTFTGTDNNIVLSNQVEFEFVAETVDTVVAQASPKSIGPNLQTSTVSVVVKDANGNLVKNKTIDFNLADTTGGTIFPASAVTDSNGTASTVYTSNTVSAQDGVSITATVRDQPTKQDTVTLTVADRELFIAIGTGNDVEETDNGTTYTKKFVAFVTDADSNPVVGQKLTVSAVPDAYYKGQWAPVYKDAGKDEFLQWVAVGVARTADPALITDWDPKYRCVNEDVNRDGILDSGEDTNGDGRLTPGNVIASLITVSTEGDDTAVAEAVTDEQGKVNIDLVYAQSFGAWVDIDIVVSGKVSGTESFTATTFTLPVSSEDVLDENITPPTAGIGANGPFGLLASCNTPN